VQDAVLFDHGVADSLGGQGLGDAGADAALGKPKASGRSAESAPVLFDSHPDLGLHRLGRFRQQRQEPMGGAGSEDLKAAALGDPAESGDQVASVLFKQPLGPVEAFLIHSRQAGEALVAGMPGRLPLQQTPQSPPVLVESPQKKRIAQHGGQSGREGTAKPVVAAVPPPPLQDLQQGQVRLRYGFERPQFLERSFIMADEWEMGVENESDSGPAAALHKKRLLN